MDWYGGGSTQIIGFYRDYINTYIYICGSGDLGFIGFRV